MEFRKAVIKDNDAWLDPQPMEALKKGDVFKLLEVDGKSYVTHKGTDTFICVKDPYKFKGSTAVDVDPAPDN